MDSNKLIQLLTRKFKKYNGYIKFHYDSFYLYLDKTTFSSIFHECSFDNETKVILLHIKYEEKDVFNIFIYLPKGTTVEIEEIEIDKQLNEYFFNSFLFSYRENEEMIKELTLNNLL